jgi:hypothetical protein
VVANALSKKYEEKGSLFSLSIIVADLVNEIRNEWFIVPNISNLIQQLQYDSNVSLSYTWHNDELCYKRCLYLIKQFNFKSILLFELHASPTRSHFGFHKTYERIKRLLFLEGMKKDIHTFVVECSIFQ